MAVQEMVAEAFDREVLESDLPVVVDFYADWCMPCRALAPEMETLSERWAARARFVKVDVDRAPELSQRYGVTSIPTVLLFRDGEVRASTRGAKTAGAVEGELGLTEAEPDDDPGHALGCAC